MTVGFLLLVGVLAVAQDQSTTNSTAPTAADTSRPLLQLLRTPAAATPTTVASSEPAPTAPTPTSVTAPTEPPPKAAKTYHDGSLRDIDAIGNRKVGCDRGIGNWYSLEKQIEMGRGYAQQVESTTKLVTDPEITEYINRIGQNLVRNSDAQVPFTIKVVDTDDINAFALPGGFFYVDSGLILAADNEAELAGVMAHEIAHVAACHLARENTRGQLMQLASIPLIFVGGGIGYAAQSLASMAIPMGFLKFARSFESEADFLGVEYLYRAGLRSAGPDLIFRKDQSAWRSTNPGRWPRLSRLIRKPRTALRKPSRRSIRCCLRSRCTSWILRSFRT